MAMTDTLLKAAQTRLAQRMTEAEFRQKSRPVLEVFRKNTNFLIPNIEQIKLSENRSIEVDLFARTTDTIASERKYLHSGNQGSTQKVTPTWTTYARTFSVSLKQMNNNFLGAVESLSNDLLNAYIDIHDELETDALAYLATNKTQVNPATANGAFDATNYIWDVNNGNEDFYWSYIQSMMRQNKYNGAFNVISDATMYAKALTFAAQGQANQINKGFQFQGLNHYESIDDFSLPTGHVGGSYIIPEGMIGMIPWIPGENRRGEGDPDSFVGGFYSMPDLFGTGLEFAVHSYRERADNSSRVSGVNQDVNKEYEISIDVSFQKAPISTANVSPIFLTGLLS